MPHLLILFSLVAVEAAILRPYRDKAKINTTKETTGEAPHARNAFRAAPKRCCKIGHKVAQRRISCNIKVLDVVRKFSDLQRAKFKYNKSKNIKPSRISARLSDKIGKCSAAFPKYFEKCCVYKEQYHKNINKCKKRPRQERRQCRQSIRERYS
ncbi:hypothetical protein C0Q70_04360 [Pomacea canaliculata]|uniref:Uncharacterized protein n=1 Tax=Pomacea canaliculata TaxID=400727 RepID=A0A2T7PVB5_POMCA|nr:hypothetical protein C0Q70_04360 [Pomacea canaliculata]